MSACTSSASPSGAPKNIVKPSIQVSSSTTFTLPGMNPPRQFLVYCDPGPVRPSSNTAEGFGVFVPPNPNRLLVCDYRGTRPDQLVFHRGVAVHTPSAIAAALDAATPRRTATGSLADVCPPHEHEALVLVFGYSYRMTVFAYVSASGCAYELTNNTTISVPLPTLTSLRRSAGYGA
jgi:hypothetical protein